MSKKVQVWLRRDQADCVVTVLNFMRNQFDRRAGNSSPEDIQCAAILAKERVLEIRDVFMKALAHTATERGEK